MSRAQPINDERNTGGTGGMGKARTTKAKLCEYIRTIERDTGKLVTAARIEGRAIVLEFGNGSRDTVNPADLVDMS